MRALVAALFVASTASAQVTYGVSGGAAKLNTQQKDQTLTATLQWQVRPWLGLGIAPGYIHAENDSAGVPFTSTGLGDMPVAADFSYSFDDAPWSPDLGTSLTLTLPTGLQRCGLGTGTTGVGLDLGVGVQPVDPLHLAVSTSRDLTGQAAASLLDPPHATSLAFEASYDLSPRVTAGLSFGGDFGTPDSGETLPRTIGGGTTIHLPHSPFAFAISGGHSLTSGSPKWAFTIGFGTAFAGTDPVGINSSLHLLKKSLNGSVNRGSGKSNIGGSNRGKGGGGGGASATSCS
ncbi:MAG TPA: hypothetical protein VEV39_05170 [Gemmatimonadales bacterium]|nr:hypothetical protein [Gemmatimonadales bacterium]